MDVFGTAMAFFMLCAGAILTVRTGFFQFTHLGKALRSPFRRSDKKGGVSPFGALATALGSSVGTANIAGVAGALAIGGPGAVFWMWAAGLLGMATKLAEVALAMRYRRREGTGYAGGPMYYMERALPRFGRGFALVFSAAGCGAAMIGTALVQGNTSAEAACSLARSAGAAFACKPLFGAVTALAAGAVIFGGARRTAAFSEAAVPFMAGAYVIAACCVAAAHRDMLLPAFKSIITGAFSPRAAAGGGIGALNALRVGVARGVYSNEAGVGSAPIAHAGSSETDPVKQGMMGVFEVFADTIVMCTLTALAILASGAGSSGAAGLAAAEEAFASVMGPRGGAAFTAVSSLLFAFTSLTGWELYGEKCLSYLTGGRFTALFRLAFLALIPIGAAAEPRIAWLLGELFNYLMALPNTISLLLLSGTAAGLVRQYKLFEKSPRKGYNKG